MFFKILIMSLLSSRKLCYIAVNLLLADRREWSNTVAEELVTLQHGISGNRGRMNCRRIKVSPYGLEHIRSVDLD